MFELFTARGKSLWNGTIHIVCRVYWPEELHGWGWISGGFTISLRWRHNDHDGVSNHQPHGCLLNRLFRRRSNKTSKLRVTGLCVGNSPGHDRWIPRTKDQLRGKCFHLMTSSCSYRHQGGVCYTRRAPQIRFCGIPFSRMEIASWLYGNHDHVIKWKHFPRYCPFVRGTHPSPVYSPHTGQWRGALMFSLICAWINNRAAGDWRRFDLTNAFNTVEVWCTSWRHMLLGWQRWFWSVLHASLACAVNW